MTRRIFSVFLSSTGKDLAEYRAAVRRRLDMNPIVKPICMEDFVSSDKSSVDTCIELVNGSDVLVGLIGFCYGNEPEGRSASYTQIEYEEANKRSKPCLMHVAPKGTRFPADSREPDVLYEKQKIFRETLQNKHMLGRSEHWASPELLASAVAEAVSQCLAKLEGGNVGKATAAGLEIKTVTAGENAVEQQFFRDVAIGPALVRIASGHFSMGSPQREFDRDACEGPLHEVVMPRPFAVGRYPVTVGEFAKFAGETGFAAEGIYVWANAGWEFDREKSWKNPGFKQSDSHPVVGVSFHDASEYCKWLTTKTGFHYRLPSEAEWEYCCRAGTSTAFWWGNEIRPENANYDARYGYVGGGDLGTCRQSTVPVDTFSPNQWGLSQMHGNVWEWCADSWNDNYVSCPTNGTAWISGDSSRAPVRGGAWQSMPHKLRSAKRDWDGKDLRGETLGFRVVRELRD